MTKQEAIDFLKRLPLPERLEALRAINDDVEVEISADEAEQERRREAAWQRVRALCGQGRSDYTDVASDKYRHLAEIYADTCSGSPLSRG